ncbi:hypothetical protein C368_02023 [Cryptococcus neoformans 125.91]|nr:hypothetical protein C368_02023 [Cryptococcus neoformans var. grubii 125.91]
MSPMLLFHQPPYSDCLAQPSQQDQRTQSNCSPARSLSHSISLPPPRHLKESEGHAFAKPVEANASGEEHQHIILLLDAVDQTHE